MKISVKIITTIMLIFIIIMISTNVYADVIDPMDNPESWNPHVEEINEPIAVGRVRTVLGIINAIGAIVSVIALMIIGIKYMLGSIEQRAEYKKTMMGYVIGAVLLGAITTIANIIYNFAISL